MKALVTGGSGFIGRHLTERLLEAGWDVVSVDLIHNPISDDNLTSVIMNAAEVEQLIPLGKGCDVIFHLAANTDVVSDGLIQREYERTFLTTKSVLECVRVNKINKLFFASSSAVYGNRDGLLREDMGELRPVSYYGAYKLASESLINAYSAIHEINSLMFRLPNIVGPNMTHGVVFDFVNKIRENPLTLEILGDGKQEKQYAYVMDIIDGMAYFMNRVKGIEIYNISNDSSITVDGIADIVCEEMDVNPEYGYTGGSTGWEGDIPRYAFDISRAKAKGWTFKYNSEEAVRKSVRSMLKG